MGTVVVRYLLNNEVYGSRTIDGIGYGKKGYGTHRSERKNR